MIPDIKLTIRGRPYVRDAQSETKLAEDRTFILASTVLPHAYCCVAAADDVMDIFGKACRHPDWARHSRIDLLGKLGAV